MKREKGITLVALVVTIVVLLILAGVSINFVFGENGLITQAQEAKRKTAEAKENEITSMDSASDWVSETVNNTSLPQNTITKPYMPSSEFKKVEGTNLANGLVIEDASDNQYVWVEVPMTEEVYPTAGLNITEFNSDIYTKIENDLHSYTNDYRKETKYVDEWCEDTNNKGEWYSKEKYDEIKRTMLKSIYQNGGFWIGRYEVGVEQFRIRKEEEINLLLQTKEGLYPYTYITRTQAKRIVEQVNYGEKTSSLLFGVQWDLTLKFIENKREKEDSSIKNKLINDSILVGNYYNSEYIINRGKYAVKTNLKEWYSNTNNIEGVVKNKLKLKQDSIENAVLLTTGASDQNKLMNIYDLAGNVWEWTLEYSTDTNEPCAHRGGSAMFLSNENSASSRVDYGGTSHSSEFIGFRISIY